MRKWLVLTLPLLMLFPFATRAQAQSDIKIETLTVQLWPEYDQPSMLVIYDFELTADASLPASVGLRIPKDANITAAAYRQGVDFINAEFAGPVEEANWQIVTFFVKERTAYHLEYYQPLTRDGNGRSFNYQWAGGYPVKNLRVEIQLPGDSTAVKSSPMAPFIPDQQALRGSASASNLDADATYQLNLSYTRLSNETVVTPVSPQVTASEPITQNTTGRVTLNNLPYILGGVGALLIVGAIYYFWRSNSMEQTAKPRRKPHKTEESAQVHCHECGARANTDDRFCRVCGTKLRGG